VLPCSIGRRVGVSFKAVIKVKTHWAFRTIAAVCISLLLQACASIPRVPIGSLQNAQVAGIPNARFWGDEVSRAPAVRAASSRPLTILALSGGGAEGAYGAGFLKGWSETGNRPRFDMVTGTSVGSLMAPFAFLGPEYDEVLESFFTSGLAQDLLKIDGVNVLFGAGAFKSEPLKELIARYATPELIDAIAVEHRKGRMLMIATTNLDAQRTTIWNMGAIAASDSPNRVNLFRTVLAASTSIPGVFAPTFIDVEADGGQYSEMHVDGGVTSNVLAVPEGILVAKGLRAPQGSRVYVVVNGKLAPDAALTSNSTIPIVARSFFTTVKANTRNTLIATYEFCRRNGWGFFVTAIDAGRAIETVSINFDTAYMRELFDYGLAKGRSGHGFQTTLDGMRARASQ
jgi:predicted patatin/cPLA2 family phospholipase